METAIEGIQDVFDEQERINRKKRNLQRRDDQTAADWLELAEEYKQIDSRANVAYCQSKAERLGGCICWFAMPPDDDMSLNTDCPIHGNIKREIPVEEKEEWWQK